MQIAKEIINNPKIKMHFNETLESARSQIVMSKFTILFLVCLIIFTSLLVKQTLQIQHSCQPMIYSATLPTECQIAAQDNSSFHSKNEEVNTPKQPVQIAQNTNKYEPNNVRENPEQLATPTPQNTEPELENKSDSGNQFINEHSDDIIGGVAGIAGAVGIMAAATATAAFSIPVAGAVAIGLGIWFVIRSVL